MVSTADIEERPIMTAAQAIQGKAAGIQVVQPLSLIHISDIQIDGVHCKRDGIKVFFKDIV